MIVFQNIQGLQAMDGRFHEAVHDANIESQDTVWKTFERHDFEFQGRQCRIIKPHKAALSKPWIWRARFPDWHTEADSILVSEGFHLVYINTNNKYGSPEAVSIWNDFYEFVRAEYDLNQKVALMGVSRGGLFVYNWAKENVDKVSCIYAEAPVCDFKSWPGGFGTGKGSQQDWQRIMDEYDFKDKMEALAYSNNPLNGLDSLAAADVPIMHMIGLKDKVVPPDENTLPLVDKYISLGGTATVIPCTKGRQNLEGHHFEIETPRIVADFVKYNTKATIALDAGNYHIHRSSLRNSFHKFKNGKEANVAFLGGSITYNPGWRDSIAVYLVQTFPETDFNFINAGIPSMGSTPAAFRLDRDVLNHGQIDLLFEEAAVNDETNGRTSEEQLNAMEGIIRKLQSSNPAIDIVMMHFVDPGKMKAYHSGIIPTVIKNHERVAEYYNIPTINLAREVTERIDNGEFDWENDFVNLHPSPFGQGVYAMSIINFLETAFKEAENQHQKSGRQELVEAMSESCYDSGEHMDITNAQVDEDWKIDPNWNPKDGTGVRDNYHNVPMLIGDKIGSELSMLFTGKAIGIAVAAGQDAGMIEYRIDSGTWRTLDLFTRWSKSLHLPWYYTLDNNLGDAVHKLELRIIAKKNPESAGNSCRIRYFYVNN